MGKGQKQKQLYRWQRKHKKKNPFVGTYSLQTDEAIKGEKLTTKEKQSLLTFAQCESWISLWELFKFTPVRAAAEVAFHSRCPTSPSAVN